MKASGKKKDKLIFVKFGGSLITDKKTPFKNRLKIIQQLSEELSQARKEGGKKIILGHGSGSYAHVPAKKYQTAKGLINKDSIKGFAEVQDAAARLNRVVILELIKKDLSAVSVNPSSFIVTKDNKVSASFTEPLISLLELDMLPVVYGDVVFDSKKGCSILSTEDIFAFLVSKFTNKYKIAKIIYCGITDGVLDKKGNTVEKITPKSFKKLKGYIGGSEGIDVTGGMRQKVEESLKVAKKYNIKVEIINGLTKNSLKKTLLGKAKKATTISAD